MEPRRIPIITTYQYESSESDNDVEPRTRLFRKPRLKRDSCAAAGAGGGVIISTTKEGYLLKGSATWSFQRWRRRYFRLEGQRLYYSKDPKGDVLNEIDISNLCFAECGIKNVNHSFQVITPDDNSLVLCADSRREMEDWLSALKAASSSTSSSYSTTTQAGAAITTTTYHPAVHPQQPQHHHPHAAGGGGRTNADAAAAGADVANLGVPSTTEYFEGGPADQHDFLCNHHHWYATSHIRPTYCGVCRDALSGVTSHGLACEVCKCKVHKRCAAKAIANCKWTTLASVGKDIIEDQDGNILMPHQWHEGNLPVSSTCAVCKKTCGSVLRLQDWRCLWCRCTVHTACRPQMPIICPLGQAHVSVVPPTALHSIGLDEAWDIVKPGNSVCFSPLLVFVNSKSGDNQGVKFLRRFKQLLNPAQVFDLISTGPGLGLRLFRHFDPFRILVCSGDGSVGWVVSEIDRLGMNKQCQIAVLPLGTGNDLARVLGWGSSCDDDAHLPQLLERYEKASTKMLDRWSVMVFERPMAQAKMSLANQTDPYLLTVEDTINWHLHALLEAEDFQVVISATKNICEVIHTLLSRLNNTLSSDEQLDIKCDILKQKFEMLLDTLNEEEQCLYGDDELLSTIRHVVRKNSVGEAKVREKGECEKNEKDQYNKKERRSRLISNDREALQYRANSLKRAIRNIVKHSENNKPRISRRLSTQVDSLKTHFPFESSPCNSPSPVPPGVSPAVSINRLSCLSPLPDQRRDSSSDDFFFNLPVPKQFADNGSRRSSGVPERIPELEENSISLDKEIVRKSGNMLLVPEFKDFLKVEMPNIEREASEQRPPFYPKYENERPPFREKQIVPPQLDSNILIGDSMNIIDTDQPEKTSSDELASDILSAISNEECSVGSEILDKPLECDLQDFVAASIQDLESDTIGHIDSPETSDALHGESLMDDISSLLGHDILGALQDNTITEDTTTLCALDIPRKRSFKKKLSGTGPKETAYEMTATTTTTNDPQCGFENRVFDMEKSFDKRYASLAQFVEGSDIARKSFKRKESSGKSASAKTNKTDCLDTIKIEIQGSHSDLSDNELTVLHVPPSSAHCASLSPTMPTSLKKKSSISEGPRHISFDDSCKKESAETAPRKVEFPKVSVIVEPPSPPVLCDDVRMQRISDIRRHSSHTASLTVKEFDKDRDRRHSGYNPNLLGLDSEHMKFLNCSPAATRRISCGSLFKPNESYSLGKSKSGGGGGGASSSSGDEADGKDEKSRQEKEEQKMKRLPIINPLVCMPSWPNITSGATGFISKCLMANADTLCAAVSPLMDPDETLQGYYEKCVMNNYFGIGIDAKISLDFHNKREEYPQKCRSRARNYMWYGVLGSKQFLQNTYKNLEQRVQLECDGQRIPLPSLSGIVVLNIPSFMGGTNFWGGTKENDCFLAPSFDDRILEVVAVFGSVQMAASRLINLQHHRIAQCQSVIINIIGDEEVPIQVDGEAWLQPPGIIKIIHKNRCQMLCRNRNLELSLKSWQQKQRQHSISIAKEQTSTANVSDTGATEGEAEFMSERETYLLLNFIEVVSSLVKCVKILIISHPSLQPDLYAVASKTGDVLEAIHPNGKIIDGPHLRVQLAEIVNASRQLYEETCALLRARGQSLILREDLESKLSVSLAHMERELRKCDLQKCEDHQMRAYLNVLAPPTSDDSEPKKSKPFWLRFRSGTVVDRDVAKSVTGQTAGSAGQAAQPSVDGVDTWDVSEVATWLETMQLGEYVDSFTKNDIRGKELLTLGRRDLKDLGVTKVGHVKRLLQAIKDLGGHK